MDAWPIDNPTNGSKETRPIIDLISEGRVVEASCTTPFDLTTLSLVISQGGLSCLFAREGERSDIVGGPRYYILAPLCLAKAQHPGFGRSILATLPRKT